jgi:hypothetical protein
MFIVNWELLSAYLFELTTRTKMEDLQKPISSLRCTIYFFSNYAVALINSKERNNLLMSSTLVSRRSLGAAFSLVLTAALFARGQQAPLSLEGKTAEQVYDNIQVLQGIPADQLNPTMRVFEGSLGVGCFFCHVSDFSKDDKETKVSARKMITMVSAINKSSFGGLPIVTCNTCHHGSSIPVALLTLPEQADMLAEREPQPALPTADQILAKYVEALGGEQAIRKVTSRLITVTRQNLSLPTVPLPALLHVEQYEKAPNLTVTVTQVPDGIAEDGFDGNTVWSQDAHGHVTEAVGVAQTRGKRAADFYECLNLKQEYTRLVVQGKQKVGEREAYLVLGYLPNDFAERLFFDTQSGLLLRKITTVRTTVGDLPTGTEYDDYRDVGDDVKLPFLIRILAVSPTISATIHVQKVQENMVIDNSKFAKPENKVASAQ